MGRLSTTGGATADRPVPAGTRDSASANPANGTTTGWARQFWLGAGAIMLMLCAVILAVRAMQVERASLERMQEQLARAADALELQRLAHAVQRGDATATPALLAAIERRERYAGDDDERSSLRQLHATAAAAPDPRNAARLAALEAAIADYAAIVRERAGRSAVAAQEAGRLSQTGLAAASLIAVVLGAMMGVVAWRATAANRRLVGQLGQLAHEDALTGVLNRRALNEYLPTELARAARLGYPLSVVMLDLDHFKRFNDRRGHGAGDALLRSAAQGWLRQLRPTDLLARYGGEEFTLVLPACDSAQAEALVERLRPQMPERQTFSAGIATWNGTESADELLRCADVALLQAKRNGRNRTVVAGREPQISLPLEPSEPKQQVIPT